MPLYNGEAWLEEAIGSLRAQSYQNWELIVVDDASTDKGPALAERFCALDSRIRLLHLAENNGAAVARNRALEQVSGRYVAYLDADDRWRPDKLEKQLRFMEERGCGFSCSSYQVMEENGRLRRKVQMPPKLDYKGFLSHNLLQTVGVMVDLEKVNRDLLVMPNLRRRQDAATWLQILKAGHCCYGLPQVLAEYRRTKNSLSSNKLLAVKGMWHLYRKVEGLPLLFSCFCFVRYALLAIWKRL